MRGCVNFDVTSDYIQTVLAEQFPAVGSCVQEGRCFSRRGIFALVTDVFKGGDVLKLN